MAWIEVEALRYLGDPDGSFSARGKVSTDKYKSEGVETAARKSDGS
jgi:hypothetical protein